MEKKARYSDSAEHGVRPYHWIAEPRRDQRSRGDMWARGHGRRRYRANVQMRLRRVQRCKCGITKLRVAGGSPGWLVAGGSAGRQAGEVRKERSDFAHGYFPGLPARLQIALVSVWVERLTEKVPPQ